MRHNSTRFVFFGTPDLAVTSLETLGKYGLVPSLIVTAPDRRGGRGMRITSPPVVHYAQKKNIPFLQPKHLDQAFLSRLAQEQADLFVIVAYGQILPALILDMPPKGILNLHPSLLPHHRGPSPIETQILADDPDDIGVTIMLLDEKMDHGPLLAQTKVDLLEWPVRASELKRLLAYEGSILLAQTIPSWLSGNTETVTQKHKEATYCKKITKEDAFLDIEHGDPYQNYLKICAYDIWPRCYFFTDKKKRVVITDADYKDGKLLIQKVIPEGKKEIDYKIFLEK